MNGARVARQYRLGAGSRGLEFAVIDGYLKGDAERGLGDHAPLSVGFGV